MSGTHILLAAATPAICHSEAPGTILRARAWANPPMSPPRPDKGFCSAATVQYSRMRTDLHFRGIKIASCACGLEATPLNKVGAYHPAPVYPWGICNGNGVVPWLSYYVCIYGNGRRRLPSSFRAIHVGEGPFRRGKGRSVIGMAGWG